MKLHIKQQNTITHPHPPSGGLGGAGGITELRITELLTEGQTDVEFEIIF